MLYRFFVFIWLKTVLFYYVKSHEINIEIAHD